MSESRMFWTEIAMQDDELRGKTCAGCEYFDRHHGDCLNRASSRFQTMAGSRACRSWVRDSTAEEAT